MGVAPTAPLGVACRLAGVSSQRDLGFDAATTPPTAGVVSHDDVAAPPRPGGLKLSARIADLNTKLMAAGLIESNMSLPGLERSVFGAEAGLGHTFPQRVAALEDKIKDLV